MESTENENTGSEEILMSQEAKARTERLLAELETNPPIQCPITFTGNFNEDTAQEIASSVRVQALFQRDDFSWMNFGRLRQVVFHHDYEQGIRDAAGDRPNAPAPTKEAGGFSIGMVVRSGDGVKLVMHESVGHALISKDLERQDLAVNVVRHELCHVHDFEFKLSLIEKHPDKSAVGGFNSFLFPMVESLWDEYFANKYSCGPWTDAHQYSNFLCEVIPTIKADVQQAILAYRLHHDLGALREAVEPKVKFIAQCFGYAIGTLAALGKPLVDHEPDLAALLSSAGLQESWDACYSQLEELDACRPHWESVLDLAKLVPPCVLLMAAFGLRYRPEGDGAYIEVPYTPETMPPVVETLGDIVKRLSQRR